MQTNKSDQRNGPVVEHVHSMNRGPGRGLVGSARTVPFAVTAQPRCSASTSLPGDSTLTSAMASSPYSSSSSGSSPSSSSLPSSSDFRVPLEIDVTDEELAQISVRQLNQRLQGHDRDVVSYLKHKRRTLKNRGYAFNCRVRRLQTQLQLEADNMMLKDQLRHMRQLLSDLQQRLQYYEPTVVLPDFYLPAVSTTSPSGGPNPSNNPYQPLTYLPTSLPYEEKL